MAEYVKQRWFELITAILLGLLGFFGGRVMIQMDGKADVEGVKALAYRVTLNEQVIANIDKNLTGMSRDIQYILKELDKKPR